MYLTPEKEQAFVQQYDHLIWSCVRKFRRKMTKQWRDEEDLHQEAVLVFLSFLRSCNSPEDIKKRFPFQDIKNAMSRHAIGEQVVSFPKSRTSDFSKIVNSTKAVELAEETVDAWHQVNSIDDLMDKLAIEAYKESLEGDAREVIAMKMGGKRNREIARKFGVSDVRISRLCQKLGKEYQQFVQ